MKPIHDDDMEEWEKELEEWEKEYYDELFYDAMKNSNYCETCGEDHEYLKWLDENLGEEDTYDED